MNTTDIKTNIPWESLSKGQKIKASPSTESDIWWVRLQDGKFGFIIIFNGIVDMNLSQIRFNGADANLAEKNGRSVFALSLKENADIEIFNRFGEDLVSVPVYDNTQKYADALFVRMKQWMKFLQKLRKKELDIRMQAGLMAELYFFEYMHSTYSFTYEELLMAWQGPENASKDFMFQDFCAEVKSCFADENIVRISNEKQLMQESKDSFFVCYQFIQDGSDDNLAEIIKQLKQRIRFEKEDLLSVFEQKLLSSGYNPAVSYENLISLKEKKVMYYKITEKFPRITVKELPECISNVKYDLNLFGLSAYEVTEIIKRKNNV